MKIMLTIIILISTIVCLRVDKVEKKNDNKYIYNVIKNSRTGYSKKKYDTLLKYSSKSGLEARYVANLGYVESTFRHYLVNKYSGCVGLYQISPKHWKHLVHHVQDGKYSKQLKTEDDYIRVMKYIAVNTEMACIILSNYINQYGNYTEALYAYGGWNKKKYRNSPKKYEYVRKVLK
jgi:soluble lytic murein transglycosylase-like protein